MQLHNKAISLPSMQLHNKAICLFSLILLLLFYIYVSHWMFHFIFFLMHSDTYMLLLTKFIYPSVHSSKLRGWVSKETVVLHWWLSITRKFGVINWVDDANWPTLIVSKLMFRALALCQSKGTVCKKKKKTTHTSHNSTILSW